MQRRASAGFVVVMLTLLACSAAAHARTGPVELGAAANTGGFMYDPDPRYRATLAGYDSITAETAMKIADLQPQRGTFDFTVADAMVAFAQSSGQHVFGHTLTWCTDSTMPAWLRNGSWSRTSLLAVMENHITTVMTHFRGRVAAWDVVNEALRDDGTRRDCLWSRVIGDDWVEQAFRFARRADPTAKLFYNEVRADVPGTKHDATVALVRDLRARGVPIDGVGLQYHLTARMPTQAQTEEAIRRLGELGVDVHISELDVPVWYLGSTPERKQARQAEVYRAVGAACHAQPACVRITTWGFMDRYTWRQPWESSLPLPFDAEYRPKAAWTAMHEALNPPAPPQPAPSTPTPATESPPGAVAAAAPPPAEAQPVTPDRPALALEAKLRRQLVRTWLARRALAVALRVHGTSAARVKLIARLRGRVIGRGSLRFPGGSSHTISVPLTTVGVRRLRDAGRNVSAVVTAVATEPGGGSARAISRVRLR